MDRRRRADRGRITNTMDSTSPRLHNDDLDAPRQSSRPINLPSLSTRTVIDPPTRTLIPTPDDLRFLTLPPRLSPIISSLTLPNDATPPPQLSSTVLARTNNRRFPFPPSRSSNPLLVGCQSPRQECEEVSIYWTRCRCSIIRRKRRSNNFRPMEVLPRLLRLRLLFVCREDRLPLRPSEAEERNLDNIHDRIPQLQLGKEYQVDQALRRSLEATLESRTPLADLERMRRENKRKETLRNRLRGMRVELSETLVDPVEVGEVEGSQELPPSLNRIVFPLSLSSPLLLPFLSSLHVLLLIIINTKSQPIAYHYRIVIVPSPLQQTRQHLSRQFYSCTSSLPLRQSTFTYRHHY